MIEAQPAPQTYHCNGVTTTFAVPFKVMDASHVLVILYTDSTIAPLTLGADYTVAGVGEDTGASITTATAHPHGDSLLVWMDIPATQETDYVNNDAFPAQSHEDALDRLTLSLAQLRELAVRTQHVPFGEVAPPIPNIARRAGRIRGWSLDGASEIAIDPKSLGNGGGGGGSTTLTSSQRPVLYRYLEKSPTPPENWSFVDMGDYIDAFLADCYALKVIGDASGCGRVRTNQSHWVGDDSGFDATPAPHGLGAGLDAGTVFVRKHGPWAMSPVFAVGANTTIKCSAHYPDAIDEINALTVAVDPVTGAVTITGQMTHHAPFIVSDHIRGADGTDTNGRNTGNNTVDVFVIGAEKIVHFHEADPAVEPWSTIATGGVRDFSAFDGNACNGNTINVTGCAWGTAVTVGRATVSNHIDVDLGVENWSQAAAHGGGVDNALYYLCQKAKGVVVRARTTGGYIHGKIRNAECLVEFEAGRAPPRWVAGMPHDSGYPFVEVDGDPYASGPDYGKFAVLDINIGSEQVCTGVRIMPDAFLNACKLTLDGRWENPYDPTQAGAMIDDQTDASIAGIIRKPDRNGVSGWSPATQFNGGNLVLLSWTHKAAYRIFQSTPATVGRHWRFLAGNAGIFCQQDQSLAAFKFHVTPGMALTFDNYTFSGGTFGGKKVFDITAELTSGEITAGLTVDEKCLNALTLSETCVFMGYDKANPSDITAICPIPDFDPVGVFLPNPEKDDDDDGGGDDGGGGGNDLVVTIAPTSRVATRSGAGVATTGAFVATVTGGVAPYTYAWVRTSGDAAITAVSPSASSTTATATLAAGDDLTAGFTLTVTDSTAGTPLTATATAAAELIAAAVISDLTLTITPSSRVATRHGAGVATTGAFVATVSGGVAPYSYSWAYTSGDTGITLTSPTGPSTEATGTLALGDALHTLFTLTVTDSTPGTPKTITGPAIANLVETS